MGAARDPNAHREIPLSHVIFPFAPHDIRVELARRGTHYLESRLRHHIVCDMYINAPTHHAVTYPDLRRVLHGKQALTDEAGELLPA